MYCKGTMLPSGQNHERREMDEVDSLESENRWRCPECGTIVEAADD